MGEGSEDSRAAEEHRVKVDSASPCDQFAPHDDLDDLSSAEQIKGILTRFVDAVNARMFDVTQLPWTRVAPDYTAVLHDPKNPIRSAEDIVDEQKHYVSLAPEYSLRLLSLEISYLNEESGKAILFWTAQTLGLYADVSVHTTGLVEFRRIGQKWMASKFQGARGMNAAGPVECTDPPFF